MENVQITITDTDTLKMEYLPLPIQCMQYRFLYRFLEPVETVWSDGNVIMNDDKEGTLKKHALKTFIEMVKEGTSKKDLLHPNMQKLLSVRKCDIAECQIVRK